MSEPGGLTGTTGRWATETGGTETRATESEAGDFTRRLRPNEAGLVAAVVQQYDTGEVLMMAWMDAEALRRTLATGRATYWSRSRKSYWIKGETSGHHQHVRSVALDCDGDALLVKVDQVGAACHTGTRTCFTDVIFEETDQ